MSIVDSTAQEIWVSRDWSKLLSIRLRTSGTRAVVSSTYVQCIWLHRDQQLGYWGKDCDWSGLNTLLMLCQSVSPSVASVKDFLLLGFLWGRMAAEGSNHYVAVYFALPVNVLLPSVF
jgi:hypothetical protein